MAELLLHNAWLIPLYPAAACVIIWALGRKAPGEGGYVAVGGMVIAAVHSWLLLACLVFAPPAEYAHAHQYQAGFTWAVFFGTPMPIGFMIDNLAAVMCAMVTLVSALIFIYSLGYMHGERDYPRFFAYMSLFGFSMLTLVISANLLLMYVGWELVGICSYLLIGFWFERRSAANAAKKAFITNRVGDFGFLIGIMILFANAHTFDFGEIFAWAASHQAPLAIVGIASVLLFCGAIGKSAQFPLHVWLPDAMEGPTSVSALIHAATMVAAGVYMIARIFPLFVTAAAQTVFWGMTGFTIVAVVGCITLLLGAFIAVTQNDIKRVLAYSTISQLGYMMLGLGMGVAGFTAGVFHLITHAFFKALLFLGSGSVIHGTGTQDMWKMGGLWTPMRRTAITFLIGTAALCGIIPFAGFFSKDEILLACWETNKVFFLFGEIGAFLTAFYMTRQCMLVFFGRPRDPEIHPHESPPVMTVPLMILAFFAAFLGWVGSPWTGNLFHHFVHFTPTTIADMAGHGAGGATEAAAAGVNWLVIVISTGAAALGVGAGYVLYSDRFSISADALKAGPLRYVYTLSKNKCYFDELYQSTAVAGTLGLAWLSGMIDDWVIDKFVDLWGWVTLKWSELSGLFDDHVIDKLVDATGKVSGAGGWIVSRLQDGSVQHYIIGFVAVTAGIVVWVLMHF